MYFYLPKPNQYYRNLIPLLKPGGKLIIVEWKNDFKTHTGQKKPFSSLIIHLMKITGWRLVKEDHELLEKQYFLVFEPLTQTEMIKTTGTGDAP
jgi:hypothetical protein